MVREKERAFLTMGLELILKNFLVYDLLKLE
jgi:hypothetical protein